jgi:hypothetical protein
MDNYTLSSPYLSDQSMNNPIVPSTNRSIPPQTPPPAPSNGTRISLTNNIPLRTSLPGKHCWVCFATDEDDFSACWVSPCRCRGTAKWVHQECLQRWVDEKQQGSSGGLFLSFLFFENFSLFFLRFSESCMSTV